MTARKKVSTILKILIVATSLGGVVLSLFGAQKDGYSHWARRLLYFTAQSNIWLGVSTLFYLLFAFNKDKRWQKGMFAAKFVFTVCITLTGVVFCGLLAPFADNYGFRSWSISSVLTHAVTPLLAIVDFFIERAPFRVEKRHVFLCALPPVLYFGLTFLLEFFYVDFGRGEPYPYFFMNFRSPVGMFGFSNDFPFIMGTFYWFTLFPALLFIVAVIYRKLHNKKTAK